MSASSPAAARGSLGGVRAFGSLVAFSHTVFALPFAASAVVLALSVPHAPLSWGRALAMLGCMVSARTAAMAFNRYLDRHIDAKNPRTAGREIPAGVVSPAAALGLTLGCSAAFVALAAALGPACGALSPLVLAVLLGYSYTKRFTWAAHLVLGLALALAPGGAWLAMGAAPNAAIVSLMLAVLTWVAGFDVLYSLQDEAFDRGEGLHSIPARFGTLGAVAISAALHVVTVAAMALAGALLARGAFFFVGTAAIAALLVYEHAIVGRGNLARIDRAFFTVNGYVSVLFFALTLLDALRAG
ncbi:MAG TPA: UbiA-like polyprenyltransferase [Polyangiaceae bacterium]|nr:UbiA-like polyprenyltransferase [Polyangiaceae bacterium]